MQVDRIRWWHVVAFLATMFVLTVIVQFINARKHIMMYSNRYDWLFSFGDILQPSEQYFFPNYLGKDDLFTDLIIKKSDSELYIVVCRIFNYSLENVAFDFSHSTDVKGGKDIFIERYYLNESEGYPYADTRTYTSISNCKSLIVDADTSNFRKIVRSGFEGFSGESSQIVICNSKNVMQYRFTTKTGYEHVLFLAGKKKSGVYLIVICSNIAIDESVLDGFNLDSSKFDENLPVE